MSDVDTINDALVENATGPAVVIVAGQEVDAKSVSELIAAANHIAARDAASNGRSGLRLFQFVPPGGG